MNWLNVLKAAIMITVAGIMVKLVLPNFGTAYGVTSPILINLIFVLFIFALGIIGGIALEVFSFRSVFKNFKKGRLNWFNVARITIIIVGIAAVLKELAVNPLIAYLLGVTTYEPINIVFLLAIAVFAIPSAIILDIWQK